MTPARKHLKIGLLALLAVAALALVLFILGIQRKPTDTYYTYFDESVQGLELGALVKYRGVRIGKVHKIAVAPDRRLIEVALAIDRSAAHSLELDHAAADLRAQIVIFGITGVKLIDLDFADPKTNPAPPLSFIPPGPYIPSRQSLLNSIDDDVRTLMHRGPALIDSAIATLDELKHTADDISRVAHTIDKARIGPALRAAVSSLDDIGKNASGASDELVRTMRDISEAARSLRELIEEINREPDMLIKGRARTRR